MHNLPVDMVTMVTKGLKYEQWVKKMVFASQIFPGYHGNLIGIQQYTVNDNVTLLCV